MWKGKPALKNPKLQTSNPKPFYLCRMQILNGKETAKAIKDLLKIEVAQLMSRGAPVPHLVAILVGTNGASETYVASKVKACNTVLLVKIQLQ